MSFKKTNISYKDSGLFSKVLMDYVGGDSKLLPFYQYTPTISSFADAIANVGQFEYQRKLLVDTLQEYYNRNAPALASDATLKNIQKLESKNCFTVTTGHQLCLFTGPLYFIFKIITAINLAEKLNKEYSSNHFVPVYWMASEDHDFAEINHTNLFGKKVEWSIDGIGGPVGKLPLTSFAPTLESLFTIMGEGEINKELKQLILDSYSGEKTLAEATFSFVNALFGRYGVVIVEPDNANFKKLFAPIITDELVNGNSYKLVTEINKMLVGIGVEPQVHPREINLFYVDEQGRNRIEKKGNNYEILGTGKAFTQTEITELVKSSPEKFSPNVVLRPVYQQSILPNVAYIGGPAEMAYWMQFKAVFDYYKVPFPVLMPRNSALIINKAVAQKMSKLNIEIADLFKETETLIKEVISRSANGLPHFEEDIEKLKEVYNSIGNKIKGIDPTLVALSEAELQKQYNALKNIETKLARVIKQKEETSISQVRKLKEILFPNGALQERTENFIPFYLQQGNGFFDMLKTNFDPFEFSISILHEE